ncbi:MAG: LysR family transcriptional regulator, partial [Gammaproteobacteria bacterium]|nr:LysR family transcriptional regulator [Gammaproteobacteria bacterium]
MYYTLKQLRYFVTVAEHQSVTRAAVALHVSQPAISSAIAQLETIFDVQLLIRHQAKGVDLTSAGRAFVVKARQLLVHADELSAASTELGESLSGGLDIGCFVTLAPFFLPTILKQTNLQYPDINVTVHEGAMDTLRHHLLDGTCEIALLYELDLDERIESELMVSIPPYALLAKDHPLAQNTTVSLKDLAHEAMILIDLPHSREYFR